MASEEGRLVGSGSFSVDSRRAVAVLRERQVPLDFWRPALWVRCATACGATKMSFERSYASMTIRFDGEPLPPAVLKQPYGRLAQGEPGEAERWFGWALLHTAVAGMKVTAASGRGSERAAYSFSAEGSITPADKIPGKETVISVRYPIIVTESMPAKSPPFWSLSLSTLSPPGCCPWVADAASFPIEYKDLNVRTLHIPWESRRSRSGALYHAQGRRIWVAVPARKASLRLALLGTLVHDWQLPGFPIPLEICVDDPGLLLDASLASPLRDDSFQAAVAAGRAAAERFALALLDRHAKSMALVGAMLLGDRARRLDWVAALGLVRGDEPSPSLFDFVVRLPMVRKRRSGDFLRITRTAESLKVLREAARNSLRTPEADKLDPVRTALWQTPLFFSTLGKTLSLMDLSGSKARPCSWTAFEPPRSGTPAALWAISPLDTLFLVKRFPQRKGALR